MNILAIGDVVGKIGCNFLRDKLPQLKKVKGIDIVIANGENSADGNGITPASADFLFTSGVDVITTGNHSFRRKESYELYDECEYLIRPANFPSGTTPGRGMTILDMGRCQVAVINLMGTAYLEPLDCPFKEVDKLIKQAQNENAKIIIVDFHAEATGEKRAMGYYLDGRVSAVFGTHTHVQTADATILPNGTGYITDAGMTGTIHSVLGVKPEIIIKKFTEKLPQRFDLATGDCKMNCVLMEIDEKNGKTINIEALEIL
ncbi:MAG: TIGR00282 family metallophosphoesterase [Acutalibacteraceae bacterium]|nr:TIGR00282 family metallophosphoesterase [Acutalibacteraceae bacterium]